MLPPQAPPAYVAHANQSAVDTLQRMRDTQQWLVEQQAAMPELPFEPEGRPFFLADLDAFWAAPIGHAPGNPRVPRRNAFAQRLAQVARDDASLRHNDGTLAGGVAEAVASIARQSDSPLPGHLHASELLVGAVPYAGALVLQNDRDPAQVLLFTTEAGWQAFPSLEALYSDVEDQWRQQLIHQDELPGVGADDMEEVIGTHFLGSRPIDGNVFGTLAERLIARQRERFERAWQLGTENGMRDDALHLALDPHTLLDVHGIVRYRDLTLAAKREEERLSSQPAKVAQHWRDVAAAYREHAAQANEAWHAAPLSLEAFALDALAIALREHGIASAPGDVQVRLTRTTLEKGPIATAFSGFAHEDISLLELALRNIGSLPAESLSVIGSDGSPRNDIPVQVLRDIVRELDIANAYPRYLDTYAGNTPEGRKQRESMAKLQAARMRFEAADARLSFYDSNEPGSFTHDREERGFQWVQAVLDHPAPAGRARVGGHEIVVHQLTYRGTPLAGVFLLAARQNQAVSRVVLYTPDAPDGIAFREFADRAQLTRDFLLKRRFETYLLDRLPTDFASVGPDGKRHFEITRLNANRSVGWVFNLEGCEGCTQLAEHFEEREVTTSFLDVAYETSLALARRNAGNLTRSTVAADLRSAVDVFWYWNLPVQLTQELVTQTVKSIPRTAQAAWRFYDHAKSGESTDAFLAFVDGYTNALNALPLYAQVPRMAGAHVRAAAGARTVVPSQRALPAPEMLFDKRYLVRDMAAPAGDAPASGVYTIRGQRYIRQDGQMYEVRYDADIAGWRLTHPAALDARVTGPAIERLPDGQWQYRRVGLLGGTGRAPGYPIPPDLGVVAGRTIHPSLASLTRHQLRILFGELLGRFSQNDATHIYRRMMLRAPGETVPLTSTDLIAWNEALTVARQAPRLAPDHAPTTPPPVDLHRSPAAQTGAQGSSATAGTRPVGSTGSGSLAGRVAPSTGQSILTRVLSNQVPDSLYVYRPASQVVSDALEVTVPQRVYSNSVEGVYMTTFPPTLSLNARAPGTTTSPLISSLLPRGVNTMSDLGAWIRVDMRALMSRSGEFATRFHLFHLDGSTNNYILRPLDFVDSTRYSRYPVRFYRNEVQATNVPWETPPPQ